MQIIYNVNVHTKAMTDGDIHPVRLKQRSLLTPLPDTLAVSS